MLEQRARGTQLDTEKLVRRLYGLRRKATTRRSVVSRLNQRIPPAWSVEVISAGKRNGYKFRHL